MKENEKLDVNTPDPARKNGKTGGGTPAALLAKYREAILYVFFGGCTTLVNWGSYALTYNVLGIPNVPSVIIAWVLAVAFAFVTNKIWVFESRSWEGPVVRHELWTFLAARIVTGLLDLGIMALAVDVFHGNGNVWKLVSNVVVVILNYVASRLFIFTKGKGETRTAPEQARQPEKK